MIMRFLIILVFYNCFLFATHKGISIEEWENSTSKIELEKKLNYIVSATKKPIYQLRFELLKNIITPLIDTPEISAVIITDNFSEVPFLTAYKENEEINIAINQKEKQLDNSLYFILESKIIYENIHIADVILYIYKNKISIPNKKDLIIPLNLSKQEMLYLEGKKEIKICTIPNALPYEKIEKNNTHLGIFSDIIKIIEKNLNTNIIIVKTESFTESLSYIKKRKCDILTGIIKTSQRETYLNFTDPYLIEPLVIATNNKKVFINNTDELYHQKVGIIKGYAFLETLKNKYPDIYFIEVDNAIDGLENVNNNQLFAFVDTLPSIAYYIQKNLFTNLKISGKLEEYIEIRTASRYDEPILNLILQKAHNAISRNTIETIVKKWSDTNIQQVTDFQYLIEIIIMFIIIILITLFWMKKLSNTNKKLEESHKKLEILASTDSMTGLYNRGHFSKVSQHLLSLAKRNQTNLSVIMLDIDNFKSVNDTHGHSIGDEVIISLANKLKALHRKSDLSCRFGGEEFVLLLPNTNVDNALLFAEKIRFETEKIEIKIKQNEILKFTVSIGVSSVQIKTENNIEESIKRADDALYLAKENGKNKVCIHDYCI